MILVIGKYGPLCMDALERLAAGKVQIRVGPEIYRTAPEQVEWAEEHWDDDAIVISGSQTIINIIDARNCKEHGGDVWRTSSVFLWKEGELVPLKDCVHLGWASHFALGDIYASGEVK